MASPQGLAQDAPLADDVIRRLLGERIDRDRRGVGVVVGVLTPAGRRVVAPGQIAFERLASDRRRHRIRDRSLSKVFTGWLLADMATRGEVSVNDPIRLAEAAARVRPGNLCIY